MIFKFFNWKSANFFMIYSFANFFMIYSLTGFLQKNISLESIKIIGNIESEVVFSISFYYEISLKTFECAADLF